MTPDELAIDRAAVARIEQLQQRAAVMRHDLAVREQAARRAARDLDRRLAEWDAQVERCQGCDGPVLAGTPLYARRGDRPVRREVLGREIVVHWCPGLARVRPGRVPARTG